MASFTKDCKEMQDFHANLGMLSQLSLTPYMQWQGFVPGVGWAKLPLPLTMKTPKFLLTTWKIPFKFSSCKAGVKPREWSEQSSTGHQTQELEKFKLLPSLIHCTARVSGICSSTGGCEHCSKTFCLHTQFSVWSPWVSLDKSIYLFRRFYNIETLNMHQYFWLSSPQERNKYSSWLASVAVEFCSPGCTHLPLDVHPRDTPPATATCWATESSFTGAGFINHTRSGTYLLEKEKKTQLHNSKGLKGHNCTMVWEFSLLQGHSQCFNSKFKPLSVLLQNFPEGLGWTEQLCAHSHTAQLGMGCDFLTPHSYRIPEWLGLERTFKAHLVPPLPWMGRGNATGVKDPGLIWKPGLPDGCLCGASSLRPTAV